jgi:hypothetical protein
MAHRHLHFSHSSQLLFFWVFTHIIQSCSSSSFFLPSPVKLTTTVQRAADHTLFLIGQLNQSRTIGKPAELIGYPIYILATSLLYQFSIENERRRSSKKKKKERWRSVLRRALCQVDSAPFSLFSLSFPICSPNRMESDRLDLHYGHEQDLIWVMPNKANRADGWMNSPYLFSHLQLLFFFFFFFISF